MKTLILILKDSNNELDSNDELDLQPFGHGKIYRSEFSLMVPYLAHILAEHEERIRREKNWRSEFEEFMKTK